MADTDQQLLENQLQNEVIRQKLDLEQGVAEQEAESEEVMTQEEEEQSARLILEQEQYQAQNRQEILRLQEEAQRFSSPSIIKYSVLFCLAVTKDAIDLLELTGVLAVFAWIVSKFFSAAIILIFWFTDTQQTQAKDFAKKTDEMVANMTSRLQSAARIATAVGKFPGMGRISARFVKGTERVSDKIKGNPIMKALAGAGFDSILGIDILPLTTISIFWSYYDEKTLYKNIRESTERTLQELLENMS